jgi:phospholipid/cholesterol/gamma-HCH transport system substrate-binding protein
MKISNETKVGILAIAGLTLLILGFNFLKGKSLFKKSTKIYAIFSDLGTLEKSNEVKINGFVIGKVYALNISDKDMTGIVATINLTKEVNIPKDSKALISTSLLGTSYMVIEKGKSNDFLKPGDTLTTKVEEGLLDDVKAQLTPTLTKIRGTLDSLNKVFTSLTGVLNNETRNNLQQTMANLNQASGELNGLLDNKTGALARTLNNTSTLTEALTKNTDNIAATISNAKTASEKLAALELQPTINSLSAAIEQIKSATAKFENPNGTVGALLNDRSLYDRLNQTILSAEILLDDLKAHPKRYVNLSIFGKKDKGGYLNSPLPKDTAVSTN